MNSIINLKNYPKCCEIITDDFFYIKDVEKSHCIISNENDFHLKILNPKKQNISFLKIDKCVFDDSDDEKCDCLVANEDLIYFTEIKELENFDSHSKKSKKRKKAGNQLINTINNFKINHPDILLRNVFAVIVLLPKLEDNYLKIISLKDQNVIDKFLETCGCPNVLEGNQIEFN